MPGTRTVNCSPRASIRSFKRLAIVALWFVALWLPLAVHAQGQDQRQTQVQSRINLTMEQRHIIKEIVKEYKIDDVAVDIQVKVGDVVPSTISLRAMPAEISAKISQVQSHVFFIKGDQVVIVDLKDNRVVEIID